MPSILIGILITKIHDVVEIIEHIVIFLDMILITEPSSGLKLIALSAADKAFACKILRQQRKRKRAR